MHSTNRINVKYRAWAMPCAVRLPACHETKHYVKMLFDANAVRNGSLGAMPRLRGSRRPATAFASQQPMLGRPDLIGLVERRSRCAHPVLVRKTKSIDDHRLDLLWSIIVTELKLQ